MVLAIALLGLVLGSLIRVFNEGFKVLRRSKEKTAASALAQGIAEQFSDWAVISAKGNVTDSDVAHEVYPDFAPNSGDPVTINGVEYTCTLDIEDYLTYGSKLKKITVDVSWTSQDTNQSVVLNTLKADY